MGYSPWAAKSRTQLSTAQTGNIVVPQNSFKGDYKGSLDGGEGGSDLQMTECSRALSSGFQT